MFAMLDAKLTTLLAVAQAGSFTGAAARLGLTQPAVSHQIALLEKELGVVLFLRTRAAAIPTREGLAVLRCARRMQELCSALYAELQTAPPGPAPGEPGQLTAEDNIQNIYQSINSIYSYLQELQVGGAVPDAPPQPPKSKAARPAAATAAAPELPKTPEPPPAPQARESMPSFLL